MNRRGAENTEANRKEFKDWEYEEEKERAIERINPGGVSLDLTQRVIGAAIEVHRHLGPGFLESVYEQALAVEFQQRGIPFDRQKLIRVNYKGIYVGEGKMDFLVEDRLVVELKAVEDFADIHKAQFLSYLKATGLRLGLLINFNVPILKKGLQRVILS